MNKKEIKEKVAVDLCAGLSEAYDELRNSPNPDLEGLKTLALVYRKCRMPMRADQILQEVSQLTERRTSVQKGGIISEVQTSGYGGTNETTFPVRVDNRGLAPDCLLSSGAGVCSTA